MSPARFADAVGGNACVIGGPFGSKLTQKDYRDHGIPVIRGTNMQGGRFIDGEFAYVSEDKWSRDFKTNTARRGDIMITQRGTLGQVSTIPLDFKYDKLVVSQSQMAVRVNPGKADPAFVYYYLKSPKFNDYIASVTIQTGVPHINMGILRNAPVAWPSRDEQAQLALVLTALDDKIELNRRMNDTLEAQARALFRDWFVDFGPVKAKMAGPDAGGAPYLAPDIWSLFPNRLSDDGVPEGWFYSEIGSEVDAVGGSTPSTTNPEFWNGEIAWTTPKDLSGLNSPILLSTSRSITPLGLAKISSGLLPKGTVLLSSRAPVGYLAITEIPLAVNQGYIAMRCEGRISNYFAFLWAQQSMDLILQNANGSTFQEISKKSFRPLPVIVADQQIHQQFDKLVEPLFQKIVANERESRALAQTRDLLLPKLMSGEIRVRDAEREVEVAL